MKIEVKGLRKHFGKTEALKDVSFEFGSGEIYGFIGPNGAGKTTTMRILATMDEPTSGNAYIDGVSVVEYPEKARPLIGYMPDSLPAHREMNVHEYLDFFARSYGIRRKERLPLLEGVEEFTRLTDIREKLLPTLSKGMKQRVSLARALIHNPPVLIMDEPAAGLDPRARVELRELLRVLREQGKAILISSHILTELAEICTGAAIIEQGTLLMSGSMEELSNRSQGSETRKSMKQTVLVRALERHEEMHKELLQSPFIDQARLLANAVEIDVIGGDEGCAEILSALVLGGYRVVEFKLQRAGLEEIFMKVTRGDVQ